MTNAQAQKIMTGCTKEYTDVYDPSSEGIRPAFQCTLEVTKNGSTITTTEFGCTKSIARTNARIAIADRVQFLS